MLNRRYVRENESDSFEIPAFLRKQADDEPLVSTSTGLSPAEMIDALNTAAIHARSFSDALQSVQGYDLNAELTPLIKATTKVVGDEQVTWALLIRWLSDRLGAAGTDCHASVCFGMRFLLLMPRQFNTQARSSQRPLAI